MCCGTAQNSYRTLAGLRVVFADGAVLDTEDPSSVARFRASHAALVEELARLGAATRADEANWLRASATSTRSRTPPATASTR
jgi:D-lactate dehydrogenase